MSLLGGTLGKLAAVLMAGVVLTAAGVGAALTTGVVSPERPTVESIDNQWGTITAERTEIRTDITVNNPNRVAIPEIASVSYDVAMNDVTVAEGQSGKLGLSPGRNTVTLRTHIDNGKIPAWWASHINNGEQTTVSISPTVDAPFVTKEIPPRTRTFSTDILSSFDRDSGKSVEVGGRTLLTVEQTRASWGEATRNRTPLDFSATVTNPNGEPVEFAEIGYTVSMNDITMAEGTTGQPVEIGANSTESIEINSTLNNSRLDEWWVSHLQNDEQTTLDVQAFAVVDTGDGTKRIPLPFLSKRVVFETDILGGGQANTRTVETDQSFDFERPTVESVSADWTAADSGTRFRTSVVVDNPNSANSTLGTVALDAQYRASLNDVTVVNGSERVELTPGRNELAFGGSVDDSTVQRWWVTHVNNDGRTTLTTEASAVADLGFARMPVEMPERNRTFETDMLSGFSNTQQTVTVRGRDIATFDDMAAEWGRATFERTPMEVTGRVTNHRSRSLTIVKFGYEVRMNDVVLADNETRVGTVVPGGETKALSATGFLDNEKIDDWWTGHLERGGQSELSVSYYAVVEYRGQRKTVQLDAMSYNQTVSTGAIGA